jgi:hypothetical protein
MYVKDQFRTNELSKIPGGSVVTVKYIGKKPLSYDKIKSPEHYAKKILKESKIKGEFNDILSITDDQGNSWYTK